MAMMHEFLGSGARSMGAALLLVAVTTVAAYAQNVVVMVNGEPITGFDIEQRTKFTQLSTQKVPPRQDVINELINEKLKIREGKRWGIEVSDADVDSMFASMASRARLTTDQMTQNLARNGVTPATIKLRLRADQVWQQLVRGRYQAAMQITDKDVLTQLAENKTEEANTISYDYIMRPILFLVPPGSPPTAFEARKKEAEALRSRFKSCDEGIAYARTLRDTAVRDQVIRSSADLPAELRKVLDAVPIGQMTAPEVTRLGVELFAICAKQQSKADSPVKRQARETIFSQRFDRQSRQYLAKLRREALIEYK
jgi:peptidyl-prolyl cis-trans isomerase SurA